MHEGNTVMLCQLAKQDCGEHLSPFTNHFFFFLFKNQPYTFAAYEPTTHLIWGVVGGGERAKVGLTGGGYRTRPNARHLSSRPCACAKATSVINAVACCADSCSPNVHFFFFLSWRPSKDAIFCHTNFHCTITQDLRFHSREWFGSHAVFFLDFWKYTGYSWSWTGLFYDTWGKMNENIKSEMSRNHTLHPILVIGRNIKK